MEADFSGYATKNGLKCSDGRTIMRDAFKAHDGTTVPLVWQHMNDAPDNILGHVKLENREDGVYAYGFFNGNPAGLNAKELVKHGDITALSIYANKLVQKGMDVLHGAIREVSLVLSGANPGAFIDNINIAHGDDLEVIEDEAIIYTGLALEHADPRGGIMADTTASTETPEKTDDAVVTHADNPDKTVQDVFDTFSEEQKKVVYFMVGEAIDAAMTPDPATQPTATHEDTTEGVTTDDSVTTDDLEHTEGNLMTRNVFENHEESSPGSQQTTLSHSQLEEIVADAKKVGSFKDAFLAHVTTYGIENIDFLFPDARLLSNSPELIGRRQEWVNTVINGVKKSPFSRIKSISADITLDTARAKGYVKGSLKKEEWFALQKRVTAPTTIYKKQKLDRDDMIDITDLDVVAWLKAEMRLMLDEEIARAILVGDGRQIDDDDKINETCIRPIAFEDDFYAHKVTVASGVVGDALVEAIVRARPNYRGSGNPTMFCTEELLTDLLLVKDTTGRRLYATQNELSFALRVSNIVTVPVMELLMTNTGDLIAILVNLSDYTAGADKGGAVSMFDDFDIDYNQYKYLMESRMSGALTMFKSAVVVSRGAGTSVTPGVPTFVVGTGVITIPSTTGVVYSVNGTPVSSGAQSAIASGATAVVSAAPAATYYFPHNFDADWSFTRS